MTDLPRTPGIDASFDLAERLVTDEELLDCYPDRMSIIAADHPQFSSLIEAAVRDGEPVAVVWPDGLDMAWRAASAARRGRPPGDQPPGAPIRIENNVPIPDEGHEVLTDNVPLLLA